MDVNANLFMDANGNDAVRTVTAAAGGNLANLRPVRKNTILSPI
jgi:hypothetical protein